MAWIPEDNIGASRKAAQNFWQTPAGGYGDGIGGGLAAALSGLGYGLMNTDASNATQANQTMRSDLMKSAASAPNNMSMGKLLMMGGVPDLEGQGMSTIAGARDKADAYGQQKSMAEIQHRNAVSLQNSSQSHAERMANVQHNLQIKLAEAKSEQERQSLLRTARMLGLAPPEATSTPAPAPMPQPTIPGASPGGSVQMPQPATPGAASGIPAPMPQPPTAASGIPPELSPLDPAIPPPATAPTGTANIDPDRKNRAGLALVMGDKATATKILTEPDDKDGSKAYDTELGKGLAKDMNDIRDSARKSQTKIGMLGVLKTLSESNTPQGPGTQYELALRRVLAAAGVPTDGLSQAQMFNALGSQLSLEMRDPSGGSGMPGSMSDKDREFLIAMGPNLGNTREGNRMLIDYMSKVANRQVEVARLANNYASRNKGRLDDKFFDLLGQWSAKNPLFPDAENITRQTAGGAPTAAAQPGAPVKQEFNSADEIPEGARVRDPATGQRLVKTNGKLVPFVDPLQIPSAAGSKAAKSQARREQSAQQDQAQSSAVRAQFEADAKTLSPIEMARKYDGMRSSLNSDERAILNQIIGGL